MAAHTRAGVTYKLHSKHGGTCTSATVVADKLAYRTEATIVDKDNEFTRQYPIMISTDGGKTLKYLRPENETWYEQQPSKPTRGAIGTNARVKHPSVTFADQGEFDTITGWTTKKFVLKVSCEIESDIESETVTLRKSRTVLFWVADVACAPSSNVPHLVRFGIPELDDAIDRELRAINGLVVRTVDSLTERYEGGAPRTFLTTTEVVDVKCIDVDPSLFSIPKGYRYREPVISGPGE